MSVELYVAALCKAVPPLYRSGRLGYKRGEKELLSLKLW